MKRSLYYIYLSLLFFGFTLLAFNLQAQQLKLGNHPTQIEKSAVLELESKNQGLLLTRVPDTSELTGIDALKPPDGMIIYFTDGRDEMPYGPNAGVYERKDGAWQRIAQFFRISNAPGPDSAVEFTRSKDVVTLHLPDATPTTRGLVNTTVQQFGGDKYFNGGLTAESGFRANDAQIGGNLTLSLFKNTNPTASEWFLSTDKNGAVFLQKIDNIFWKLGGNSLSGSTDSLGTISDTDLPFITGNQERMRITKDGKVGIGTSTPDNTLDVDGSFKLGNGGSSFSVMAHAVATYTIDTSVKGYIVRTLSTVTGIKANAHVIVNPRAGLQDAVNSSIAAISWVRAPADNTVAICFYVTGKINITVPFDVYFINSANP